MTRLARFFALLGGCVLVGLILLVCASVLGRELSDIVHSTWVQNYLPGFANLILAAGIGPIYGDFELVEAGMAFIIFAFFPICQIANAHANVDIVTRRWSPQSNRWLYAVTECLFALVILLITWQLFNGMLSKKASGETSLLLQFPIWWAYCASVIAAIAALVISMYLAFLRVKSAYDASDLFENLADEAIT